MKNFCLSDRLSKAKFLECVFCGRFFSQILLCYMHMISPLGSRLYRMYRQAPAKFVGNVPWVNLSQNNQRYPSAKFNGREDTTREISKKANCPSY